MRKVATLASLASVGILTSLAIDVQAAPEQRHQVNVNGDMVMFGNTLGHECYGGTVDEPIASPVFGDFDCTGVAAGNIDDSSPDIFWRSDDPEDGQARASADILAEDARSTAMLVLPDGARVTYARIYWAGFLDSAVTADADADVRIERPSADLDETVEADDSWIVSDTQDPSLFWYQSTAEITDIVASVEAGAFRVGDVSSVELLGMANEHPLASWTMVVFYELSTDTARNLTLFDGLDLVDDPIYPPTAPLEVSITGFEVPAAAWDAKFGIVTYEGESRWVGDALKFNNFPLSDGVNLVDNFFNGSRSWLGEPLSHEGDLPQVTGDADSMSGVDMDVVDVTDYVEPYDRTAWLEVSSTYDLYLLGVFVTSISTFAPNLITSTKTVEDVEGTPTNAGDVVEYTITVKNTGSDGAVDTVVTDKIPGQLTFVPGSITVDGDPQSDNKDDDKAEYVASSRTIIARVGADANDANGGSVAVDGTATVTFRARVNDDVLGIVSNQGAISAAGEQGTGQKEYKTDGNGADPGIPPTDINVTEPGDRDGDGLTDPEEVAIGTDPDDADTDDDGLLDGQEPSPTADPDGDGFINALDPDSDNDGLPDGLEMGKDCSNRGTDTDEGNCIADGDSGETVTDPQLEDTDNGGVDDGVEDADHDGIWDSNETSPAGGNAGDDDTDNDGLPNLDEADVGTDPRDADSDDDGLLDGAEREPADDTDDDGLINALDPDSDNDGLFDGMEMGQGCDNAATDPDAETCVPDGDKGTRTDPLKADTDNGGVDDADEDANHDGVWDKGETNPVSGAGGDDDTDKDELPNLDEDAVGTDPKDADSDDDGLLDGAEREPAEDTDDDGLINALDPDSDNDGLFDGMEMGQDCDHPGTDPDAETCVPDGDGGTKTDPLKADTDNGGVDDADEDANHDGVWDEGETNPVSGAGGDDDTDKDGLPNLDEDAVGTDPEDADSDDDGLLDGAEREPADDTDDDGLINALDPDSDDDGLPDGLEMAKDCSHEDTVIQDEDDPTCVPDADPATTTDPLEKDTDDGGVEDGVEDANQNGRTDSGETNPVSGIGYDDDTDGDGLPDAIENSIGTDYQDRDSDDDGLIDGDEIPKGADADLDSDKDGDINALDPDSDDDGLFDGTEMGRDCEDEGTDKSKKHCVPDADKGKTTTDPWDWDTDEGTVSDGDEDVNKNGRIDEDEDGVLERNPRDPSDDVPRETGGAGAPPIIYPDRSIEGGGCTCSVPQQGSRAPLGLALLLGGLLVRRVRRRPG